MLFSSTTIALIVATIARAGPSLKLDLSGASNVRDVDNFKVTATVINTGTEELKLYADPRSALSTFPEDSFTVSSAGGRVEFAGAKVKYSFAKASEFVTLAPGANVSVTHDLSASYNFTATGDYKVNVSNLFHYQDASGEAVPIVANVERVLAARLTGSTRSSILSNRTRELTRRANFATCSSAQKDMINQALTTATSYLDNAVDYLQTHWAETTRYTTWFGTYDPRRKLTVLSHFTEIQVSDPRKYTYDCECTHLDAFAYVNWDKAGRIYVCPLFFNAPTSGIDSKAGTIIHEASHFKAYGGTFDYEYGHKESKGLAIRDPVKAVMNADSHEYFAENTPFLS